MEVHVIFYILCHGTRDGGGGGGGGYGTSETASSAARD